MPGRFPRALPCFANKAWGVQTGRDLDESLRALSDSVAASSGTPRTPTDVTAGVAADPGTTYGVVAPASDDHVHGIDTDGTPGTVGNASAQGGGPGLAIVDHTHRLGIVGTKGDLLASDGTNPVAVTVGANGTVLMADSAQASGVAWSPLVDQDARILALIGL